MHEHKLRSSEPFCVQLQQTDAQQQRMLCNSDPTSKAPPSTSLDPNNNYIATEPIHDGDAALGD